MKRAAIYARRDPFKDWHKATVNQQILRCRLWADENQWTVVEVATDDYEGSASGGFARSRGLQRLRVLASSGHTEAVIATEPSRLSPHSDYVPD
jgi:DNA invertase Pin-like site-specific DNA recombinase